MSNRKQGRNIVVIAALLVVAMLVVPTLLLGASNVVSGYDGIVSEVVGVHYAPDVASGDKTDIQYDGTSITIDELYDRPNPYADIDPTGLRCSVSGGVGIDSYEEINVVYGNQMADGSRETWSVYEVNSTMGMSIRTVPQGFGPATDVLFTIQLSENQFSIFSNADEQYAFIVAVSTISPPEVQGGMMETDHMEGGKNFVLQPIATHEPPAWVEGAGYAGIMSNFAVVNFDVNVIQAEPIWGAWSRTESEITYDIEVDVLVFGYWEATQDTNPYENQPNPDPFAWLGTFFSTMGEGLLDMLRAGYIMVFAIVVFGLIVIYFFFVARAGASRGRGRPKK